MSKQIYVQAQADHIESLFKGSPLSAIEELVWNALDADAKEVKIDLITNPLGAVEALRITDDGTGIDVLKIDTTFGSLGGSWKRLSGESSSFQRPLHGRHGRGRFKAFSLGLHVEWRTTMMAGSERLSYRISGEADEPGVFTLDSVPQGPQRGTEVYITNVRANCDSLLDASETVQNLAAKFALYLKSYPDVRIYFNGLPVTPVIVQKRTSDYVVTLENGSEAKLEIIEWRRKFVGAGRLVFVGEDGFKLHEQPSGVRSGIGASYTAYLVSPRFSVLHRENSLVMDELNPEVRMYLDATKKVMKAHFAKFEEEKEADFEQEWRERIDAMKDSERRILLSILQEKVQ
jgi:hypothetical protein